jgi:hypothetical protein
VRLTLWTEFAARFGPAAGHGYLADAVRGFFENDGLLCYVLRLDDTASPADDLRRGLAALGGLELAIREHFAGFRSHTTLLAAAAAFAVVTVLALSTGPYPLWALLAIAAAVFGSAFYGLRQLFKRRSGGLSFR